MQIRGDQLERGSLIGGYRIDDAISRGGMGVVYRATNIALHRIYALKVLAPELSEDPMFRERFKREMRIAASLHHPNVVGIHYAGEHEGMLFLVMDFIYGTDLRQILIDTGALHPERAIDLLLQFAAALDVAHAKGLVHRDVKPANMLVTVRDGEEHGYLTDFGLAKRSDNIGGLTSKGVLVGTVDYMAPEQITGNPTDARTDIYALGCVFFQMLTGKVPYERDNSVATLFAHVHDTPPVLPNEIAALHPVFGAVIEKAMAKEPDDRYLSAGDFARDAEAALTGMRFTGPQTVVATGEAAPSTGPVPAVEPPGTTAERAAPPVTPPAAESPPVTPTVAETPPVTPTVAETPPLMPTVAETRSETAPPQETPPHQGTPVPTTGDETRVHPTLERGAWTEPAQPTAARGAGPPSWTEPAPTVAPGGEPGGWSEPAPALARATTEHAGAGGPPVAPPRDQQGRRPFPFGWLALGGVVVAAVVGAVIIALGSGTKSPPKKVTVPGFAANVRPVPTNRVTGSGTATVRLNGNVATVTVTTNGLLNAVHLMHIHGGTGNCPPASAAITFNGHPFISASVGDKFYGGVVASLTTHGDTSPAAHLITALYQATGNIRYTRTITLGPGVAAEISQGLAVIIVHGISYDGAGSYDNFLGPGAEAAAPAVCGPLFPAQVRVAAAHGAGTVAAAHGAGTVYVASLHVYGGAAQPYLDPWLVCHLSAAAVSGLPTDAESRTAGPA